MSGPKNPTMPDPVCLCLGCASRITTVDEDGCCHTCGGDVVVVSETAAAHIEDLLAKVHSLQVQRDWACEEPCGGCCGCEAAHKAHAGGSLQQ